MPTLPSEFLTVILPYAGLFCKRVFVHAQVLVTGAILTPGKRTISSVLRIMGLNQEKAFHKYHRVLSHAQWSTSRASQILLHQLLRAFIGQQPLVVGIDETLERRWGLQIKARGIYRDAVRSSGSHFVKCSGLRWMSVMLLTKVNWANRVWALPFLTALAPSERYYDDKLRTHKKLTDWARQLLLQIKRWVGERQVIAVGDSSYAVIDLLQVLQGQVSLISRLRLNAALYEPVPVEPASKRGRKRLKGQRCKPTILPHHKPKGPPRFALVRAHLGVETQRQWSHKAIARTTPVLLGLFSVVTLVAHSLQQQGLLVSQASSWYFKQQPTFSDALGCVGAYLWREMSFCTSEEEVIHVKMSQHQYQLWQTALAWAA